MNDEFCFTNYPTRVCTLCLAATSHDDDNDEVVDDDGDIDIDDAIGLTGGHVGGGVRGQRLVTSRNSDVSAGG